MTDPTRRVAAVTGAAQGLGFAYAALGRAPQSVGMPNPKAPAQ